MAYFECGEDSTALVRARRSRHARRSHYEIPELARRLGVSSATLGMMLVLFGVGSLVSMPLVGIAVASFGSRRVLLPASVMVAVALVSIVFAPSIVTGFALVIIIAVRASILDDRSTRPESKQPIRLPRRLAPYLSGAISLCATIPEGATLDWGALYLRNELGADVALSGLTFSVFSTTMATFRFLGDSVRRRLSAVTTLRLSAAFILLGTLMAGMSSHSTWVLVGFAIAGVGLANVNPIAYSAAGNLPDLAPGIAIGVVNVMAYSGFLVAPSAIGVIAEHTGLAAIFATFPVFAVGLLLLSSQARTR